MRSERSFFLAMFGSESEFDGYVDEMERAGTWGDEITLRAVVSKT